MRIKTKLSLGVGFLFLLIILLITISVSSIRALSNDSQNILVANYNTIDYVRQMLKALDENMTTEKSKEKFQKNLISQKHNITELGERELTDKLALDFEKLKLNPTDTFILNEIRNELSNVLLLNMQAIQRKSKIAENTAESASKVITIAGTICFVLAFTLLMNLPRSIADPIKELTESIKEIADKNYSKRVQFESHNEFGELAHSFNTMAKKLEEYNNSSLARLMMEKKRIETLINNMHNPVIGLDENKKIIFINDQALKIAGLKQEETIGKSSNDIAANNDLMRLLLKDILNDTISTTNTENKPVKIFADGKESYFNKERIRIEIMPTAETLSKHIGDVILLQNITSFKELDIAKTNFIATVSHEFKTPISSMIMSLQLLEDTRIGLLNDEQKNLVNSIKDDASRLLKITRELLNMTQVESGNIQLSIMPSDPKEILLLALDANKTQADQKQIQFEIAFTDDLPKIQADIEKTVWVLTNLISNAIRYSHDNSIIYLSGSKINETIEIRVKDTGQGIDEQYKDKIFDRYFRVPGTKKEGTGLGLAISKEFIEAQGGHIRFESEIGKGSTFIISLKIV